MSKEEVMWIWFLLKKGDNIMWDTMKDLNFFGKRYRA